MPMVAPAVEGIELFKIAGRSISGLRVLERTPISVHLGQTQEASPVKKVRYCLYPQDDQYSADAPLALFFVRWGNPRFHLQFRRSSAPFQIRQVN
jgi:hypothetical protein